MLIRLIENLRTKILSFYFKHKVAYVGQKCRFNHYCHFTQFTYIGNNCHFNGMYVTGGGKLFIGDNFHSGTDIMIITQNHNYDKGECIPYDSKYVYKDVTIGKNVWIGSRVTILPGTIVQDGAVIQAGSVVHGFVPKCAIWGGILHH